MNKKHRSRLAQQDKPRHPTSPKELSPAPSPWKRVSRARLAESEVDHLGISGHSQIDPEQLRRQRTEETRVYGENACQALFHHRKDAIVRAWLLQSVTPRFRKTLKWMAANHKAYRVVDAEELSNVSGTEHHGGICFLIKKRQGLSVEAYLQQAAEKNCVLALENVSNPHNLGGIMRSCAHFGVNALLLPNSALLESGAAVRTAEGGAEHIKAIETDDFLLALEAFRKAGYSIVTTSSHKGESLAKTILPDKMLLLLGQESHGLTENIWQQGDINVTIAGTGSVDSLNVSVATAIILAEW